MKNSLKKNVPRIQALKQQGHDLIDAIVKTGISKNSIYFLLREKLGCVEGNQHFYNIHTERDARKAVAALETILEGRQVLLKERRAWNAEQARERRAKERELAQKPAPAPRNEPEPSAGTRKGNILPLTEQRAALAALKNAKPITKRPSLWTRLINRLHGKANVA